MALLSLEKIREIQDVAELYATRERERLIRVDAAAAQRSQDRGNGRVGVAGARS